MWVLTSGVASNTFAETVMRDWRNVNDVNIPEPACKMAAEPTLPVMADERVGLRVMRVHTLLLRVNFVASVILLFGFLCVCVCLVGSLH